MKYRLIPDITLAVISHKNEIIDTPFRNTLLLSRQKNYIIYKGICANENEIR